MKITQLSFIEDGEKTYFFPKEKKVTSRPEGFSKTSFIIYEGPSEFDGSPIVVIASGFGKSSSQNSKTGAMVQTWILRSDMAPLEAKFSGSDVSICGDCKHRKVDGFNTCYVNLGQGPRVIFEAYRDGRYAKVDQDCLETLFEGIKVRLGSYGDPMAVPSEIWGEVLKSAAGHTGYTHQWKTETAEDSIWQKILMASADSPKEKAEANESGWRTFRVMSPYQKLDEFEISCPASKEAGVLTECAKCGLCAGTDTKAKNIGIVAHGTMRGWFILQAHQLSFAFANRW